MKKSLIALLLKVRIEITLQLNASDKQLLPAQEVPRNLL